MAEISDKIAYKFAEWRERALVAEAQVAALQQALADRGDDLLAFQRACGTHLPERAEQIRVERDALRARLTGVAVHAHRLRTWCGDDQASVTVAGSIIGDLLAAVYARTAPENPPPGAPESPQDAPTPHTDPNPASTPPETTP